MGLVSSIFTWWNSATAGTYWTTWRSGVFVGEDTQGNRYYRNRDSSRRWVIYKGLAEPSRSPRYPQRYAEIMVGEIAVEPGRGQIIDSLADVRVGPLTAQEVGWAR